MTEAEFAYLRAFLHQRTGVSLPANKSYLAESRLASARRRFAVASDADLIRRLKLGRDPELARTVLEAMTTNETFFFRDRTPFDLLRTVLLPRALAARAETKRIRIWSAAASSGQEPYSVAMLLDSMRADLEGFAVEIVATDISTEMLAKARSGLYTQHEVQRGLPIEHLLAHFERVGHGWRISEKIRGMVDLKPLNLTKPFDHLGPFDVILCRNVLIYFDAATKADVMERLADVLQPEGAVLFGAAETAIGLTRALVPHAEHSTMYVKPAAALRAPLADAPARGLAAHPVAGSGVGPR